MVNGVMNRTASIIDINSNNIGIKCNSQSPNNYCQTCQIMVGAIVCKTQ